MIAFIIPLRSAQSTQNWHRVCDLFERTLRSVCNQTDQNFIVIVVCNEIPQIGFTSPNVKYVQVDFAVTQADEANKDDLRLQRELDKARRMWKGLNVLALFQHVSYVMFVDADDCISKNIAKFVNSQAEINNGWHVDSGYEYPDGGAIVYPRKKNICDKTNTSHMIKYELVESFIELSFEDVSSDFLFHQNVRSIMRQMGHPLQPYPFPVVAYITDNGENMYMQRDSIFQYKFDYMQLLRILGGKFRRFIIKKPLTDSVRQEFGIYNLDSAVK
jgi:hypothetical protein